MTNFVFNPVPFQRLVQPLEIDANPLKTCNWDSIYCRLGRTVPLINEQRKYLIPTLPPIEAWVQPPREEGEALERLASSGRSQMVEDFEARFWSASPAHYLEET